jgi:hypothetical protein
MYENPDFTTEINEIKVELSGHSQRYVNEYCESESDGKIDGFSARFCKCSGGVTIAMWYIDFGAEIWWQGQKNQETTLQLQQNAALHRILNTFRSTPVMAVHNEATLLPVAVWLTDKLCKYTLCILSLLTTYLVV